jgi:hypothetical protein
MTNTQGNKMNQASQYSTIGYILEDGKPVKVVILRHDGEKAVVRRLGEFKAVIALNAADLFERDLGE